MAKQEEIQRKITSIAKTVIGSHDFDSKIKELFKDITINNFVGEAFNITKKEAFKIYQARYNLLESKDKTNENFSILLERLKPLDDHLLCNITGIQIKNDLYIVFNDQEYAECFGIIYKK